MCEFECLIFQRIAKKKKSNPSFAYVKLTYEYGGRRGVKFIVARNGRGNTSSNPRRGFPMALIS